MHDDHRARDPHVGGGRPGGGGAPHEAGAHRREPEHREPEHREAEPGGSEQPAGEHRSERRDRRERDPGGVAGERVVCGAGPVGELVARRPTTIKAIWVDPQRAGRRARDPVADIIMAAREAKLEVIDRERAALDRAAGEGVLHQGVVAWVTPFRYADLDELIAGATPPLVIALDGVEDPRNLGAIVRSAYLLGAGGVIIPEHRAAQITTTAVKASAGATELLPIAQVGNLARTLAELRERGLWRVAIHASDTAKPLAALDAKLPLCVVLGAEGTGIRPLVASNCDFHAVIPMARAAIGSFNVSVAAAIALYEIARQRQS
nr:23S rRNA (guanosine(2251)-2'-O)-methyltransferase RlmB [Kofleriaceae bacterium]